MHAVQSRCRLFQRLRFSPQIPPFQFCTQIRSSSLPRVVAIVHMQCRTALLIVLRTDVVCATHATVRCSRMHGRTMHISRRGIPGSSSFGNITVAIIGSPHFIFYSFLFTLHVASIEHALHAFLVSYCGRTCKARAHPRALPRDLQYGHMTRDLSDTPPQVLLIPSRPHRSSCAAH